MIKSHGLFSKPLMFILAAAFVLVPLAGCGSQEQAPAQPVRFADLGWDSARVHNRIAAFILEHGYGLTIDEQESFIPGDTIPLFEGLAQGDVDINMECWVENQQEAYDTHIAAGDVVDLGTNYNDNWQGWLVPTYMVKGDPERGIEPIAPNLTSVADLPQYWQLFQDPETPDKGRFYNSAPGWECTGINTVKLKEYGLTEYYTDFPTGSDAALAGSMVAAYQKGEPWVGFYWEPTWVLGQLDMTKLEEPAYNETIWETTRACAYPSNNVNIIVNAEWKDSADPAVIEFLTNYETTTAQANAVLAYMNTEDADVEAAAIYFLQEYETVWTSWVPADVAAKVKDALP